MRKIGNYFIILFSLFMFVVMGTFAYAAEDFKVYIYTDEEGQLSTMHSSESYISEIYAFSGHKVYFEQTGSSDMRIYRNGKKTGSTLKVGNRLWFLDDSGDNYLTFRISGKNLYIDSTPVESWFTNSAEYKSETNAKDRYAKALNEYKSKMGIESTDISNTSVSNDDTKGRYSTSPTPSATISAELQKYYEALEKQNKLPTSLITPSKTASALPTDNSEALKKYYEALEKMNKQSTPSAKPSATVSANSNEMTDELKQYYTALEKMKNTIY